MRKIGTYQEEILIRGASEYRRKGIILALIVKIDAADCINKFKRNFILAYPLKTKISKGSKKNYESFIFSKKLMIPKFKCIIKAVFHILYIQISWSSDYHFTLTTLMTKPHANVVNSN